MRARAHSGENKKKRQIHRERERERDKYRNSSPYDGLPWVRSATWNYIMRKRLGKAAH